MAATSTLNAGTGPDSLVLKISQDAYLTLQLHFPLQM